MQRLRLAALGRLRWPGRLRVRWPLVIGWATSGRRPRADAASPPDRAGVERPAWAGFGLAVAVLGLLLGLSLILPTGVVAVEAPLDPQPLQVGQDLLYRVTVVNEGRVPVWLRGVRLDVAAPLWLVAPAEGAPAGEPAVAAGRRQVLVPVGAFLLPGSERAMVLRIRALEPGEVTVRNVRLEFVQLLDPRTLALGSPALAWVADAPAAAEPAFAEQGRFGRSFDGEGYRLARVEAADDGDVARLVFVFRARDGADAEPPGFAVSRTEEGIELVLTGVQLPKRIELPRPPAGLRQLATGRTPEGDARVRIAIDGLIEYRAYGRTEPPRVVLEWRSDAAGAVTYEVRVPQGQAPLARAVLEALAAVSPPVEPVGHPSEDGGAWTVRFDRRYAADRVAAALHAAGAEVELRVLRPGEGSRTP